MDTAHSVAAAASAVIEEAANRKRKSDEGLAKRLSNLRRGGGRKKGAPKISRHAHGDNKKSSYDWDAVRQQMDHPTANSQQVASFLDPPVKSPLKKVLKKQAAQAEARDMKQQTALDKKDRIIERLTEELSKEKMKTEKHKREKEEWMASPHYRQWQNTRNHQK
mmetsp:Transcript_403/g.778  ORF Transcript_403/g.778 Transcript_403/m.778 type:complete len:164 (+) Transcript_403:297-788(+)